MISTLTKTWLRNVKLHETKTFFRNFEYTKKFFRQNNKRII